jgi:hypothetical protein
VSAAPEFLRAPARWLAAVWSRPWLGFVAVFAYALWQRWHMPWLPLATADSWGFLGPALHELAGEGFRQTHGRSIAYPLFLLTVLRVTESFPAIAMVQHALGLLSGAAWVWVFSLWVAWLPASVRRRPFVWWIGAFALGLYLLGAWAAVYETMIRPESIFPLFAFLQTGGTLVFIRERWSRSRSSVMVIAGALAMFCAVLCVSLKPSWGFAAAVPAATMLVGIGAPGAPAKRLVSLLALLCGLVLAGLWQKGVPHLAGWIGDDHAKTFLPTTLFTVHADLISKTMHERADAGLLDAEERAFLGHLDRRLEESRKIDPPKYKALGHDPDYLMYHSDALADLPGVADSSAGERAAYLRSEYFAAWQAQPALMLCKLGRQLLLAHSDPPNSLHRSSVAWRVHFKTARDFSRVYVPPSLSPKLTGGWEELFRRCAELASTGKKRRDFARPLPPWFHGIFLGSLVTFLTVAGLAVFPAGRCLFRGRAGLLPAARVFAVIVITHLGMVFTVAAVHSFDIIRYMALLSPSQSLLLGTGSALLVAFLSSAWPKMRNPAHRSAR